MARLPPGLWSRLLGVVGVAACTLIVFVPRDTRAKEVSDYERKGEYEDGKMWFGEIAITGEIKNTPTGWVLVRTMENRSDEPQTCEVEERLLRTKTMHAARVGPSPVAILTRHRSIALKPRERRSIGSPLPASIKAQMDESERVQVSVARAQHQIGATESGHYTKAMLRQLSQTYMVFGVDYLKPLARADTAAPKEEDVHAEPAAIGYAPVAEPPPSVKPKSNASTNVAVLPSRMNGGTK